MCSGFLVTDLLSLLLCVFLLDGSTRVVVGLSPCTAVLDWADPNRFLGLKRAYTGRLPGKGAYDQQCKIQ